MLALQEETIKILTSIYGYKSSFWELWQQRKEEYFKAIQTEKHLLTTPMVSFEQYSSLADDKSAFGKIAIDSPLGTKQHSKQGCVRKIIIVTSLFFSRVSAL